MKVRPLIRSSASIASFMLPFTKTVAQLINVTSNTIAVINTVSMEIEDVFPFEQTILLATPLVEDGRRYIIIEQKELLVKLHFERRQIHTDLLKTEPNYAICASSLDYQSAAFIGQQEICYFGQFSSSNDNYLFNSPRYALYGQFGLAVLYSDSLHEVWVQCIRGERISPPEEVQEDIWHMVTYQSLIIAMGSGISMVCDPWTGKLQSVVLQNANILAVAPGREEGEFYVSDCLGSLLEVTTDGKELESSCILTASQANSLTMMDDRKLFLGSRSGDSAIIDIVDERLLKRYPSLAPIHDISEIDGRLYLASGMEKTGTFKTVKQVIKANQLREIELSATIKSVKVLMEKMDSVIFEIAFQEGLLEGSALYFYERDLLTQLNPIDPRMSPFTRRLILVTDKEIVLAFIDDKRVSFYTLQGNFVSDLHIRQLAEGQSIIYCQASPDNRSIILTMTANFVCIIDHECHPVLHNIEIDEVSSPLLQATISNDGLMALLFDQVPYVILYKDNECAIQKFDPKHLLEVPPDINIFYLLGGCVPPNNTRPALMAELRDGKLLACPFSEDACQLMTGVMFMSFVGNQLIVGHRDGELGVYDIEGLYCSDYTFHRFSGLHAIYCTGQSVFVLDRDGREFLLEENSVEMFDGVIFAQVCCPGVGSSDGEEQSNATSFLPILLGYSNNKLLLMEDSQKTYTVASRPAHALARSICQLQKRYIVTASVRAQELSAPRIPQAQSAILTSNGYLSDLAGDSADVEQIPPSKRLTSHILVQDEYGADVASLTLDNVHVTRVVPCMLGKYPQEFLAISAIVAQIEDGESGFVAVYQLSGASLQEFGRFTTKRGVYHLISTNRRLLAGAAESLIILEYLGSEFQFAPPQTHGTPEGLYEVGYASVCVFMTSLAVSKGIVVFSDLAKGIFVAHMREESRGRVELVKMQRIPGKGVVGCLVQEEHQSQSEAIEGQKPDDFQSDNTALLICHPDGSLRLYSGEILFQELHLGAQVLTLRERPDGWVYGCSNGEIGLIQLDECSE